MNKQELIKNRFDNIQIDEENFEYNYLVSSTTPKLYAYRDNDKIINAHLLHIISDMNDDGWCLVACKGEINEKVIGEFLFQRAKARRR